MFESHLHPFLSSFPFVLLTLAVAGEIASMVRSESNLGRFVSLHLWLAIAGVLLAFLSGYVSAPHAHQVLMRSEEEISYHHLWGKSVLIVGIITGVFHWVSCRAVFNKRFFVFTFRLLLITLWLLSMATGFFGSSLLLLP